jgi:hypothetical protein
MPGYVMSDEEAIEKFFYIWDGPGLQEYIAAYAERLAEERRQRFWQRLFCREHMRR